MLTQLTGGLSGNPVWINPAFVVKVKGVPGEPVGSDQTRTCIVLSTGQVLSVAEDVESVVEALRCSNAS